MRKYKKMVVPIIITVVVIIYCAIYFGLLISYLDGIEKYLIGVIPLLFIALMVKVCIERINEIKKGDEDDISKY